MGKLRIGQKSEMLHCLEIDTAYDSPDVDMKVIDGPVLVNLLPPEKAKTFNDYKTDVFPPYIVSQASTVRRLDIVWGRYLPDSLKHSTREARGQGVRRRVLPNCTIPENWSSFLRNENNKTELFTFLATCVADIQIQGVQIMK